jgi:hypothetical protein
VCKALQWGYWVQRVEALERIIDAQEYEKAEENERNGVILTYSWHLTALVWDSDSGNEDEASEVDEVTDLLLVQ